MNIRKIITEYIKYSYKVVQIWGEPSKEKTVALEETLISHDNDQQI